MLRFPKAHLACVHWCAVKELAGFNVCPEWREQVMLHAAATRSCPTAMLRMHVMPRGCATSASTALLISACQTLATWIFHLSCDPGQATCTANQRVVGTLGKLKCNSLAAQLVTRAHSPGGGLGRSRTETFRRTARADSAAAMGKLVNLLAVYVALVAIWTAPPPCPPLLPTWHQRLVRRLASTRRWQQCLCTRRGVLCIRLDVFFGSSLVWDMLGSALVNVFVCVCSHFDSSHFCGQAFGRALQRVAAGSAVLPTTRKACQLHDLDSAFGAIRHITEASLQEFPACLAVEVNGLDGTES